MFGYIYPFKPDLKIKHYNRFKSYYCSLCHSIKNNYGNIPRMSLNFDTTFMAIFLDGFTKNNPIIEKKRCPIHPIEKKYIMKNISSIDYASHITIILTHNKIVDDINDENNLLNKIILPFSSMYIQKLPSNFIELKIFIENELKNLRNIELSEDRLSIDEYSHPFANLTKHIFYNYCKENNFSDLSLEYIKNIGYNLGKWIYIMDSLNDIERDIKRECFNPIVHINSEKKTIDDINEFAISMFNKYKPLLTHINYTCLDNFKRLKIYKNYDLIENILQLGMPFKTDKIINKCNSKNKKEVYIENV